MAKVIVTAMQQHLSDNAVRMSQFSEIPFKEAYKKYCGLVDSIGLDNAQYSNEVEMNHEAGGRGYDYRVELIVE